MAGDLQVHLPALQAHKGEVQGIAEGVHTAAQASLSGQAFGSEAFGIVGQVFALPLQMYLTEATTFIGLVASVADDIGDKLGQAHDAYDSHQQSTSTKLQSTRGELPA